MESNETVLHSCVVATGAGFLSRKEPAPYSETGREHMHPGAPLYLNTKESIPQSPTYTAVS